MRENLLVSVLTLRPNLCRDLSIQDRPGRVYDPWIYGIWWRWAGYDARCRCVEWVTIHSSYQSWARWLPNTKGTNGVTIPVDTDRLQQRVTILTAARAATAALRGDGWQRLINSWLFLLVSANKERRTVTFCSACCFCCVSFLSPFPAIIVRGHTT